MSELLSTLIVLVCAALGIVALSHANKKQGYAKAQEDQRTRAEKIASEIARQDAELDMRQQARSARTRAALVEELKDPTDHLDELLDEADRVRADFLKR